jgi:hypothetical protein
MRSPRNRIAAISEGGNEQCSLLALLAAGCLSGIKPAFLAHLAVRRSSCVISNRIGPFALPQHDLIGSGAIHVGVRDKRLHFTRPKSLDE